MLSQVIATTPISEVMNVDVIALHPQALMLRVKEIFDNELFHHIPVVNDHGKVVGMLSRMDYNRILSCHLLFNPERNESYNQRNLQSLQVEDVMNKSVVTIKANDSLTKAANLFRENHFHALPVINEENELIGIITTYDLLIFAYK